MPDQPTLFLIAGPNGAGKTTLATTFLPEFTNIKEFVNADLIAKGLSPFNAETALISAGRILLERTRQLIATGVSFALETTLSGKGYIDLIREAKAAGYRVLIYYVYIEPVELSIKRIAERVERGGHNVPEYIVRRRYERSLFNFIRIYRKLSDAWIMFNNSEGAPVRIAEGDSDTTDFFHPQAARLLKNV